MTHLGRQTLKTLNKGIRTLLAVPDALLDALSTMGMTCFISRSANAQKQIDVATEYVDKLIKIAIVLSPPQKLLTLYFHKIRNNKTLDEYFSQFNYYKKVKERYERTGSIYDPNDSLQGIIYFLHTIANMIYVGIVGTLPLDSLFEAFKAMCLAIDYAKDPTEEPNIYAWVNKLYDMLIIDSEDYAKLHPSLETLPINPFFAFYADMIFTAIYLKNSYEQEIIPAIKRLQERRWIKYGYTTVDVYDDTTKTTKRVFADNLTSNTINIKIDADLISPETLSVSLNHEGFIKTVGAFYSPLRIPAFFARKKKDWYGSFTSSTRNQIAFLSNSGKIYICRSNLQTYKVIQDNIFTFDKILSLKNNYLVAIDSKQGILRIYNKEGEIALNYAIGTNYNLLSIINNSKLIFYKINAFYTYDEIIFKVVELENEYKISKIQTKQLTTIQYERIRNPPLTINNDEILLHTERIYGVVGLTVSEHRLYTYNIKTNEIKLRGFKQYAHRTIDYSIRFNEDDSITDPYRYVIVPVMFTEPYMNAGAMIITPNFNFKFGPAVPQANKPRPECLSGIAYMNNYVAYKVDELHFDYYNISVFDRKTETLNRVYSLFTFKDYSNHPLTLQPDKIVIPARNRIIIFNTTTKEISEFSELTDNAKFLSLDTNLILIARNVLNSTEIAIYDIEKKQRIKSAVLNEATRQIISL